MAEKARPPSIRRRLLVLLLGATAIIWFATGVASYVDARHEAEELLDAHLAQSAALLVVQVGDEFDEIDVEHAPQLHKYARRAAFQVWEGGTVPRVHSVSAPDARLSLQEQGFSNSEVEGRRWRVFSSWDAEHRYLVQVGEQQHARDEIAASIAKNLLLPLVAALPLLAVLIWLAVTRATRPVVALGDQVSARAPDNLAPIALPEAPVELVPLVARLNDLFSRVSTSLENERRFTADAAHELRTPIAALKVQAEVALAATNESDRQHALEKVIVGCNRASHLVDQLLTLVRLDPGSASSGRELCDVHVLAKSVLAELAPAALARNVEMELEYAPAAPLRANAALLGVLLRNLIDNAVRYSEPGTTVRVGVHSDADAIRLTVTDEGPGVPESELERLGERFHRLPGQEAPGSGLGLSIVRRIAEIHGASVRFGRGPGAKGLKAEVIFPRTD
jgi:two-component system sensor histidine kinase QseC